VEKMKRQEKKLENIRFNQIKNEKSYEDLIRYREKFIQIEDNEFRTMVERLKNEFPEINLEEEVENQQLVFPRRMCVYPYENHKDNIRFPVIATIRYTPDNENIRYLDVAIIPDFSDVYAFDSQFDRVEFAKQTLEQMEECNLIRPEKDIFRVQLDKKYEIEALKEENTNRLVAARFRVPKYRIFDRHLSEEAKIELVQKDIDQEEIIEAIQKL
jgi:hypothetical protein